MAVMVCTQACRLRPVFFPPLFLDSMVILMYYCVSYLISHPYVVTFNNHVFPFMYPVHIEFCICVYVFITIHFVCSVCQLNIYILRDIELFKQFCSQLKYVMIFYFYTLVCTHKMKKLLINFLADFNKGRLEKE